MLVKTLQEQHMWMSTLEQDLLKGRMTDALTRIQYNAGVFKNGLEKLIKPLGIQHEILSPISTKNLRHIKSPQDLFDEDSVSPEVSELPMPGLTAEAVIEKAAKLDLHQIQTYSVSTLYKAMGWKGPLTRSTVRKTDLSKTVLCFRYDDLFNFYQYYTDHSGSSPKLTFHSNTTFQALTEYFHNLSDNGWKVSLDLRMVQEGDTAVFAIWTTMYNYVKHTWKLVQANLNEIVDDKVDESELSCDQNSSSPGSGDDSSTNEQKQGSKRKLKQQGYPTFKAPNAQQSESEGSPDEGSVYDPNDDNKPTKKTKTDAKASRTSTKEVVAKKKGHKPGTTVPSTPTKAKTNKTSSPSRKSNRKRTIRSPGK
jgi:hypothetical protein